MQFQFNAHQFQPATADGGNPPLPVGEWPMQITDVEIKATANNDGGYIQFNVVIIDGPHKGAAGAWRLNLFNQSLQTVQIAQRQLSSLCHITGIFEVTESNLNSFAGKQFIGCVKPNPSEKYPNGTQIGGVKDIQGNDPGKQAPAPAPAPAPTQQGWQQPQPAAVAGGWQQPQPAAAPAWAPTGSPVAGAAPWAKAPGQ